MDYLKDKPAKLPEAWMFETGINEFRRLDAWPPKDLQPTDVLLRRRRQALAIAAGRGRRQFDEYVSDPNQPGAVHRQHRRRDDRRLHDRGPALRGAAARRARLPDRRRSTRT